MFNLSQNCNFVPSNRELQWLNQILYFLKRLILIEAVFREIKKKNEIKLQIVNHIKCKVNVFRLAVRNKVDKVIFYKYNFSLLFSRELYVRSIINAVVFFDL